MADFTALKAAINAAIKTNGEQEITGAILQTVLDAIVETLGEGAINDLITALSNESTARVNADTALSNRLGSTITAENTAADQIGAEAEARAAADTALQLLIDGITENIENGYVYAGIATPSSTPATGKVFYLALTAGTYTNFGNTEVSQGINILKYNGSAWSLDAFIGIDDELTPSSNNLPKSGNVLENIIKNGSAFDLSAYNAVGGILASYADLDAALTALNALPAVYKQGGMSFKFVLTSDNKYVRYNLLADSFTTDITQWQGVDDEPTAGSNNLVKSGGIFNKLQELDYKYDGIGSEIHPEITWSNVHAYVNANKVVISNENFTLSNPFVLKKGQTIKCFCGDTNIIIVSEVYNTTPLAVGDTVKDKLVNSGNPVSEKTYTATEDKLIVLSRYDINSYFHFYEEINGLGKKLNDEIERSKQADAELDADLDELNAETLGGTIPIEKTIVWSNVNAYVNRYKVVTANPNYVLSEPFILYKGETINAFIGDTNVAMVAKVNSSTPLAIGDSAAEVILNSGTPVSAKSYTATEDIYIVLSKYVPNSSFSFTKTLYGLKNTIADEILRATQKDNELELEIEGGDKTISKTIVWSNVNAYINYYNIVTANDNYVLSEPFLLLTGETVNAYIGDTNVYMIAKVNTDTPLAIGDSAIGLVNSGTPTPIAGSYTATEDTYIVLSKYVPNSEFSFERHINGINDEIDNINDEIDNIKRVVLEVGTDKAYTTLRSALDVTWQDDKKYEIHLFKDIILTDEYTEEELMQRWVNPQGVTRYAGVYVNKNVSIIGIGMRTITLEWAGSDHSNYISVLNTYDTFKAENITFVGKNVRYCIHQSEDSLLDAPVSYYKNCKFITEVRTVSYSVSAIDFGFGCNDNCEIHFENCSFDNVNSDKDLILGHCNGVKGYSCRFFFDDCQMLGSRYSLRIGYENSASNYVFINNCYFKSKVLIYTFNSNGKNYYYGNGNENLEYIKETETDDISPYVKTNTINIGSDKIKIGDKTLNLNNDNSVTWS